MEIAVLGGGHGGYGKSDAGQDAWYWYGQGWMSAVQRQQEHQQQQWGQHAWQHGH